MCKPLGMKDMDTDLCEYCPLEEDQKGTHGTPNGYSSCEGCSCKEAYENYLEGFED